MKPSLLILVTRYTSLVKSNANMLVSVHLCELDGYAYTPYGLALMFDVGKVTLATVLLFFPRLCASIKLQIMVLPRN